jgi:hypothetical protein
MIARVIIDCRTLPQIIKASGLTAEELADIDRIVTAARILKEQRAADYVGPRDSEIKRLGHRLTEQFVKREWNL